MRYDTSHRTSACAAADAKTAASDTAAAIAAAATIDGSPALRGVHPALYQLPLVLRRPSLSLPGGFGLSGGVGFL